MWRPGELVPESGLYEVVDEGGAPTGVFRPVVRGGRFPPTEIASDCYRLVPRISDRRGGTAGSAVILGTTTDFRAARRKRATT
jgi:hypothetical protein